MRRILVGLLGVATIAGLGGLWLAHRAPRALPDSATRRDQAIAYLETALARDPDNPLLKGQLINRLVLRFAQEADLSDLVRGEALAAIAITLASDRSAALARWSGLQLMQHKFQAAFENAERAVDADPGSAEARGVLLEAALAAGHYRIADREAARIAPGTVAGQVRRATWLDAQGKTETALQLMERACRELERIGAEPDVVGWCLTRTAALVHAVRGPAEAKRLLHRVTTIRPGYRGAVEGLATLALAEGEIETAVAGFRAIVSDAHPDLYLRLAEALRLAGLPDSAAAAERKFLAIAAIPGNEALFGHPLSLYHAERADREGLDAALAVAEREVARRPTTESFDLLAWVHYRRGELERAAAAAERALDWGAPSPTMLYHRGRIFEGLGRISEGRRMIEAATAVPTLLAPHARLDWSRTRDESSRRRPA